MAAIKVFNSQLEKASENHNSVLVLGDANLCAEKWLHPDFLHQKVASSLQNYLRRTGLIIANVGPTFQSDHVKKSGNVCNSSLDHVSFSASLENKLKIDSLKNSSSDHLPVICKNYKNMSKGLL